MPDVDEVARAIAFFQQCDDIELLRELLRALRPRAAAEVRRHESRGRRAPAPSNIAAAERAATEPEARRTVRATTDFAQLQALSRAIGKRVEELQAARG
jgi:hypothetical protein